MYLWSNHITPITTHMDFKMVKYCEVLVMNILMKFTGSLDESYASWKATEFSIKWFASLLVAELTYNKNSKPFSAILIRGIQAVGGFLYGYMYYTI